MGVLRQDRLRVLVALLTRSCMSSFWLPDSRTLMLHPGFFHLYEFAFVSSSHPRPGTRPPVREGTLCYRAFSGSHCGVHPRVHGGVDVHHPRSVGWSVIILPVFHLPSFSDGLMEPVNERGIPSKCDSRAHTAPPEHILHARRTSGPTNAHSVCTIQQKRTSSFLARPVG